MKWLHRRDIGGLLLLLGAAILGNYFRWTLFFNIDFLLGGIAVWLIVCLYGTRWGTLASFVASSYTYFLWHHPYSIITFTLETLFVGWLLHHRKKANIVLLDGIFWLFIGMPLVWLFYFFILNIGQEQALIILLKQPINGIFNALVASLLLTHLPIHRWVDRPPTRHPLSLQQTLFNLFVAFVSIPILILIILAARQVTSDIITQANLEVSSIFRYVTVEIKPWYSRHLAVVSNLARLAGTTPENEFAETVDFVQTTFPEFRHFYILDQAGNLRRDFNLFTVGPQINWQEKYYFEQLQQANQPRLFLLVSPADPTETSALFGVPIRQNGKIVGALLGEMNLKVINEQLQSNLAEQNLVLSLLDSNQVVAASTKQTWIGKPAFNWQQNGRIEPISDSVFQWLPTTHPLVLVQWRNSFFVQESQIDPSFPWTLRVQLAAATYVSEIEQKYTRYLATLLLVMLLALFVANLISRQLNQPLLQLAEISTNLPQKLLDQEPIHWTKSQITEFALLIQNFRSMALSLQQKFGEVYQMNLALEQRVQQRTQALQESNVALREQQQFTQQIAERQQLMISIAQRIRQTLDLDQINQSTVVEVRRLLDTDRVIVYRFAPDWSGTIIAESVTAEWKPLLGEQITDSYFVNTGGNLYPQGRVIAHEDVYTANLDPCHLAFLEERQVRAKLVVPILQDEFLWGLLVAHHCRSPRPWDPLDIELLQQLATQLSIAIQQSELFHQVQMLNANLENQVQERTGELQQALEYSGLLKRITEEIRDSLDEQQILQKVVQELTVTIKADCCDTALYNSERTTTTIQYEHSQDRTTFKRETFRIADASDPNLYVQLFQGRSVHFCLIQPNVIRPEQAPKSVLACPIADNQGVLGDLWLFKPISEWFNEREIHLVQQVAIQCAIALRQSRLYQAAQAQVEELERLNQLKDDFLSTVSHELRSPMSSIKMATQMLEISLNQLGILSDEANLVKRYFKILQEEGQREINLINDLLDLARLDAGTEPLSPLEIRLQFYIPHISETFAARMQQQQQHFILQIPENLPPITTDLRYLERILTELLHNACKYTPHGETIKVSAEATSDAVEICVSNSGTEISPVECDRIFDKFYRIPNNDPWKHGGTGLGLALVKGMLQQLGGTIAVSSHSQPSTTSFTIRLPYSIAANVT